MALPVPYRLSAALLLATGFALGVLAAVGCGGSGGTAFAEGGSPTVVHAKTLQGVPVVWMNDFTFSLTYTPSDPNTRILAVEMDGEIETGGTNVEVIARSRRAAQTEQLGNLILAQQGFTAPLSIVAPYALSAGFVDDGTFVVEVFMNATTNGTPVTINALTLRIVTTEGVMVMDPSPAVS